MHKSNMRGGSFDDLCCNDSSIPPPRTPSLPLNKKPSSDYSRSEKLKKQIDEHEDRLDTLESDMERLQQANAAYSLNEHNRNEYMRNSGQAFQKAINTMDDMYEKLEKKMIQLAEKTKIFNQQVETLDKIGIHPYMFNPHFVLSLFNSY
jgi:DNA repair exonuclease SbcCD ATPase subunit